MGVAYESAAPGEERGAAPSEFARALLERAGGRLWAEAGSLCLEVPTDGAPSAAHAAHDVAGAR